MTPTSPAASRVCLLAREQISARLDGELDQLATIRLRVHLAGCATCRSFQRELETITDQLRAAEPETVPPRTHPVWRTHRKVTAFGMALAAASLIAVVLVNPTGNHERPDLTIHNLQWHADPSAYDHTSRMA